MPSHYGHKGMEDIYAEDTDRYHDFDEAVKAAEHLEGEEKVDALSDAAKKRELGNNMLKEISGTAAGTGVEIGAGYATDLVTVGLLNPATIAATGGLSVAGYAGLNFASGVASNYAAQKLRGEEKISYGELLTSGAVDLIPFFGTKLKGAKGITNIALQSGAKSVLQRQGEVAIDEQRPLTFAELVQSGAFGGAFGTAFKGGGEIIANREELAYRMLQAIPAEPVYAKTRNPGKPQDWQLNLPFKQGYVPPDASQIWNTNQKLLKYSGLFGSGTKFNINAYRNIFNSAQGRQVAMLYSTTPHTGIATTWDKHRRGLVDTFESVYGDAMQQLQIPRSRIEIEHIFTLQQSMPIYDGLSFGDPMFNKVQQAILTRGYKPGNAADNLMAVPQWIHGQKTNYFNILHGKDGRGFFTRTIVRKFSKGKGWTQKQADAFRLKTLERYLDEIDKGKTILDEGMKVFDTLHGRPRLPEELVEELADIELHRYSAPELKSIVKDIVTEFDAKPLSRYTKAEFMEYLHRLDDSGDMLKDLSLPEQVRRLQEITGMSLEEIDSRMQAGWFTDLEGF